MYAPFDLTHRVALISGGNGGIGLGMAEALAQAGADLVIWGTNAAKNAAARQLLEPYGRRVVTEIVDVADESAVKQAMQSAVAAMGRIDTCIANAGISLPANSFFDIDDDNYRRVMAINLDGAIWTMREACRHMVERANAGDAGGSIVGVSSMVANFGAPGNQHYAASKMALIGVVKSIAVEYARHGIRANALLPGWVETDMTGAAQNSEIFNKRVIARVPQRRWGTARDFGGIAVYLASTASAFHTGDSILIDGGYSAF
jgi:NAD(P)-dependent dehydrogenase (short-subunit alcohol dehydrogenase family)